MCAPVQQYVVERMNYEAEGTAIHIVLVPERPEARVIAAELNATKGLSKRLYFKGSNPLTGPPLKIISTEHRPIRTEGHCLLTVYGRPMPSHCRLYAAMVWRSCTRRSFDNLGTEVIKILYDAT
jgi:hypothetical protein